MLLPVFGPRSVSVLPERVEQSVFPRIIHALPETVVTVHLNISVGHGVLHGSALEEVIGASGEIFGNEIFFDDHEAAVDVSFGLGRFFIEFAEGISVDDEFSEAGFWVGRGEGDEFILLFVLLIEGVDIDISDTVSVGEEELFVIGSKIFRSGEDASSGHSFDTGTGESDLPVGLFKFSVEGYLRRRSETYGCISGVEMIIDKIVNKTLFFITETENEAINSESGV